MLRESPSPYTVLNFLTLGLGELIDGAIAPEEPWSFQHFMDMVGVFTIIYGAAKGIKGALGADDAAGMADDIVGTMDDTLDDAARAAAGSIDDVLDDAARDIGEVIKTTPADDINRSYLQVHSTHQPPYWPGTQVYQVRLTQQTNFVRVYGGGSKQAGQWIMRANDIVGLTAEEIMDKFSLPQKPTYICNATIPSGTILEVSGAN